LTEIWEIVSRLKGTSRCCLAPKQMTCYSYRSLDQQGGILFKIEALSSKRLLLVDILVRG
jgi:hypothetical protein